MTVIIMTREMGTLGSDVALGLAEALDPHGNQNTDVRGRSTQIVGVKVGNFRADVQRPSASCAASVSLSQWSG